MNLSPPRGTRDFYPAEMRLRSWLHGRFREVARRFGFEEYDAPVVESADLYVRKAGEEIVDQIYTFQDKSGRDLALRPEMTPSLARMVLQRGGALGLPIKWFSVPQCWRYERMTSAAAGASTSSGTSTSSASPASPPRPSSWLPP